MRTSTRPAPARRAGLRALGAATALVLAASLAGCGSDDESTSAADTSAAAGDAEPAAQTAPLTLADPYVKAVDSGMTAAFGVLTNDGDSDVSVVSAQSDAASTIELHETVMDGDQMAMQPLEGGLTVPAGGTHELAPGGDHLMLMDVTRPLEPGDEVTLTLTLGDGSTVDVTAPVKQIAGGDETYQSGDDE